MIPGNYPTTGLVGRKPPPSKPSPRVLGGAHVLRVQLDGPSSGTGCSLANSAEGLGSFLCCWQVGVGGVGEVSEQGSSSSQSSAARSCNRSPEASLGYFPEDHVDLFCGARLSTPGRHCA